MENVTLTLTQPEPKMTLDDFKASLWASLAGALSDDGTLEQVRDEDGRMTGKFNVVGTVDMHEFATSFGAWLVAEGAFS